MRLLYGSDTADRPDYLLTLARLYPRRAGRPQPGDVFQGLRVRRGSVAANSVVTVVPTITAQAHAGPQCSLRRVHACSHSARMLSCREAVVLGAIA
jgi:hypothetical protein